MPENQKTAINEANKSAKERADEAVNVEQEFQAPTTSQIEGRSTPVDVPTGEQDIPDLPIYSFFQPSQSEEGRAEFVQEGQETVGQNLDDVYSQLSQIGTQGERTMEAEEEAGIPQLNTQLVEIENELQSKSLEFRRKREALQTEPGLTRAQRNARLAEVARKQNMELADLEVIRAARSNVLTNAQNLVNRKLELQFADERTRLQGLQFIYEQNKDTLSQEKDRLFQQTLTREQRAFQIAADKYARLEQEKMKYVQNAAQAGADNNTLKTIQGASSFGQLYSTPGIQQYALSQKELLEMQNLRMSIAKTSKEMQKMEEPDANASLIQSLFAEGGGKVSFDEFIAQQEQELGQSLSPEAREEYREEYESIPDTTEQDKQTVLAYLVANGAIKPEQANYIQTNLELMTPDKKAKQQMVVTRGRTVLRDVDRAIEEADEAGKVAGYFAEQTSLFSSGPSLAARFSPAYELQQHLSSIKSNISIDQLQQMREASPTGGALGQVPVQQQEFLMSVLGSLNPSLETNVLKENLNDVYNVYLDVMFGSPQELSDAVQKGRMSASEANSYLQQRKDTGFNEFNLPIAESMGEEVGDLVVAPDGSLVKVK